ncbi:hypothetical protein ACFP81_13840 [Deinococcus lacus]|uniref:Uncharacterized protein n=1 Tax=Deinococcus lacus TaxID=392561 RepID=A0ABW1YHC6_9DEIO
MSTPLKELAQVALRGTARAELPKLAASPLADALARLETANVEAALLSRAALAGLHSRAGVPLLPAETPLPATLPPAQSPLPEKLWPLLRQLAETPALATALADVQARGWTLSAAQTLNLLSHMGLTKAEQCRHLFWPLLDERGQAVLDAHPIHSAWQQADAAAKWQAQLDALRELRQADAEAGAAQTSQLWQEVKADERCDLLNLIEGASCPQTCPFCRTPKKTARQRWHGGRGCSGGICRGRFRMSCWRCCRRQSRSRVKVGK